MRRVSYPLVFHITPHERLDYASPPFYGVRIRVYDYRVGLTSVWSTRLTDISAVPETREEEHAYVTDLTKRQDFLDDLWSVYAKST